MKLTVPIFGQRDSRWSSLQLGVSGYHVGDSGCTSVVTASVVGVTPDIFVNKMNQNSGYTTGGLIIWQKVCDLFNVTDDSRQWGSTPADLNWIKSQVQSGHPIVIETRFPGNYSDTERDNPSHMHWLVVVSDDFVCNDPWFSEEAFFQARYGDPGRWIYSAHCFSGKNTPVQTPTNQMTIDKSTFEGLVTKSTEDDAYRALNFGSPSETKLKFNTLQSSNDDQRNKITDLTVNVNDKTNQISDLQRQLTDLKVQLTACQNKNIPVSPPVPQNSKIERIRPLVFNGWITYLKSRGAIQTIINE